jgi:hypothetical protein
VRPAPQHTWPRWTARLRLTLWYGGLFLLAGLVLVATSYLLVRQQLTPSPRSNERVVCGSVSGEPVECQKLPPDVALSAPGPGGG